ncbi:uncharacterized protein DNG_02737 [Cephalotrichum gorgonifer]|uniref:Proteasome inhibitor PI31 subunit n=1 Tax=Cephalotrichum gorgonifer TaxID=2041049 RepID=A0AAE8MTJ8_9PEZI|nr:uncharacterized protein DNG_02737 [Cephalotrichum gorgonifer]
MSSPLSIDAILQGMADAIPSHPKGDTSSDLSTSYEVLALLIHSYMTALKFRLLGFDEDKRTEDECTALAPRLPAKWNASFGSHSFVYAHKQSAMTFVVKVDRLGSKVEVRGLAVGDDRIYRFERNIRDVVRSAALPLRITLTEDGEEDRSDLVEKLRGVFVSEQAINDTINDLKVNIVQKFIPSLQAEGYTETETEPSRSHQRTQSPPLHPLEEPRPRPGHPYPINDPLAAPPPRPRPIADFPPPGFEDEHEINSPPRGLRPPHPSFDIGHDDLHPPGLGPHDPLRPSFIGGGGLPRPGGFGGMHPTLTTPCSRDRAGARGRRDSVRRHRPARGGIPLALVAGRGRGRGAGGGRFGGGYGGGYGGGSGGYGGYGGDII